MDIRILAVFAFCLLISIVDIITYRIPDIFLISMLIVLFVIDIMRCQFSNLLSSFLSMISLSVLFFIIYRFFGGLGFGDVKFAGVLGYTSGFKLAVYGCLLASILGIIWFIIIKMFSGKGAIANSDRVKLPFAPFLSLGICFILIVEKLEIL